LGQSFFGTQKTQPGFTGFPEGALRRYFVGATISISGKLILDDPGKGVFL
jgi:hypothetical protein